VAGVAPGLPDAFPARFANSIGKGDGWDQDGEHQDRDHHDVRFDRLSCRIRDICQRGFDTHILCEAGDDDIIVRNEGCKKEARNNPRHDQPGEPVAKCLEPVGIKILCGLFERLGLKPAEEILISVESDLEISTSMLEVFHALQDAFAFFRGDDMATLDILEKLVAFPTVSRNSNLDLIHFARDFLMACGADCVLVHDETGDKANLYATIGPADCPGVMLSGHTDVVPIDGQNWTVDPFLATRKDGRIYGRGTTDMKGFVASALHAAELASTRVLQTPLHLALSYDEEIGCLGVRRLIDMLAEAPVRPAFCIVGEPTSMAVATGHKGKIGLRATCLGREGHSALAPLALNAVHLACDFIGAVRRLQADMAANGARDGDYDIPYTTLHVGKIQGGVALNIVPNHCDLDFEIRHLAEDDPAALLAGLREAADDILREARDIAPEADITFETTMAYPGLATPPDADVVSFVKSLTGANDTIKVAFGTEGGLFNDQLSIPTVICGPGSMAQGHKPDEFVSEEQLARCDAMLAKLLDRLVV